MKSSKVSRLIPLVIAAGVVAADAQSPYFDTLAKDYPLDAWWATPPGVVSVYDVPTLASTDLRSELGAGALANDMAGKISGVEYMSLYFGAPDGNHTNFYAEMGGQVGDTGVLTSVSMAKFDVNTTRVVGPYVLHIGAVTSGTLKVGDTVTAIRDVSGVADREAARIIDADDLDLLVECGLVREVRYACLPKGRCNSDLHCALGQICDFGKATCVDGCRFNGDCPGSSCRCGDVPCACSGTTPADLAKCTIGVCDPNFCSDNTFCRFGEQCGPPPDAGVGDSGVARNVCYSDYDPDRRPYCANCSFGGGRDSEDDGDAESIGYS